MKMALDAKNESRWGILCTKNASMIEDCRARVGRIECDGRRRNDVLRFHAMRSINPIARGIPFNEKTEHATW